MFVCSYEFKSAQKPAKGIGSSGTGMVGSGASLVWKPEVKLGSSVRAVSALTSKPSSQPLLLFLRP